MTITYQTTIKSMYCVQSPEPDYVVNVIFEVSGDDGQGHTASIGGNCQFAYTEGQQITPYANLTQAIVLGWINEAGVLPNLEANIDGQIASMVNPPVSPQNTALPWA